MRSMIIWVKQGHGKKFVFFIALFLVCASTLFVTLRLATRKIKTNLPVGQIDSLVASIANEGSPSHASAVNAAQHPDSQTLQLIVAEIKFIGSLEQKGDYVAAREKTFDLCPVLKIAGTNLSPLLPDARSEFLSGDSIGASCWALVAIGGDAWKTLLQGLTNSNPKIQLCATEAMEYADKENSILALPFLDEFLTNSSDILRIQTVNTIGHIPVDSEVKIKLLIRTIHSDTNIAVVSMAIKALGLAGGQGDYIQGFLKQLSTNKNEHIRTAATTALGELKKSS